MMDYMTLARTGVQLSRLALGTGNFGIAGAMAPVLKPLSPWTPTRRRAAISSTQPTSISSASRKRIGKALEGRREDFMLASMFTNGAASRNFDSRLMALAETISGVSA